MSKRRGRKSAAQTPAPKSERIFGSKKNPKGSASSEKSAKNIKFSEKTINSLKKKLDEFQEKHKKKNITLNDLKAVYRRGSGAYSSSHRPTITGGVPNTRNAWAMARVNKFLKKAGGEKVKAAYVQDDDLMANGGKIRYTDGEDVDKLIENGIVELKMYDTTNEHSKIYGFDAQRPLYIQTIFVTKEHRGKGIGRKVMEYIIEYANKNGNDVIFGNITQKAEPSIDVIKSILVKSGFNTIEGNNDFYKIVKDTDDDLLKMHLGGDMSKHLVPNGKPSNLTHEQWHLVRTPEFKAWFGDWENDPENASKVVDENGEPLVVYHGSGKKFTKFDKKKIGENYRESQRGGFFFTQKQTTAQNYAQLHSENQKGFVYECFLNIKNPILRNTNSEYYSPSDRYDISSNEYIQLINSSDYLDGIIIIGTRKDNLYVIFKSNQIKLADGTNTTFDGSNPDIRFDDGGSTENYSDNVKAFYSWFIDWYKGIKDEMTIIISLTNELRPLREKNVVFIDKFKKNKESVKAHKYLQEIIDKADEYGITIYLEPTPIGDSKTKLDLVQYYKNFGFELNSSEDFMKRVPKEGGTIFVNGFFYDCSSIGENTNFTLITYNSGGQENLEVIDTINPLRLSETLCELLKIKKIEATILINQYLQKAQKLENSSQIVNPRVIIVDRDVVVSQNLEEGGEISEEKEMFDIIRMQKLQNFEKGGGLQIICMNCNWSWNTEESEESDKFVCHKCGFDNTLYYSYMNFKKPKTILEISDIHDVSPEILYNQLEKGIQIEKEHTNSDQIAKIIALHHIEEYPDYYDRLQNIENPVVTKIHDFDKMKEGGVVVGKRHSESDAFGNTGERFLVKSTGQVVELEGGEGVLCKESMTSEKLFFFEGKQMTARQIASYLNHKYGGVQFEKGGGVCGCREYYHGGELPTATLDSLEGGEAVVTVKTMESKDKYEFMGKKMTPRKILSELNSKFGGKKFENGGTIDLSEHHLRNELKMIEMQQFVKKLLYFKSK